MVYIREQPDPDFESLPHGRYDIVTKDTLQKFPDDILRAVLERADFQFVEFVEGEFTNVEIRRTDSLIKVLLGDELVLVHIEFQVGVGGSHARIFSLSTFLRDSRKRTLRTWVTTRSRTGRAAKRY